MNRLKGLRLWATAVMVVGCMVAMTACTGDSPENAKTSETTEKSSKSWKIRDLEDVVFNAEMSKSTILGSGSGNLNYFSSNADPAVTVEVNAITATKNSTIVDFTLKSKDPSVLGDLGAFNESRPLADDVRDIAIIAPGEEKRFLPYLALHDNDMDTAGCACSDAVTTITSEHGRFLSGIFPPLDAKTRMISLDLPGIPTIENLPVVWK